MTQGILDLSPFSQEPPSSRSDGSSPVSCAHPRCGRTFLLAGRQAGHRKYCGRECQRRAWEETHPRLESGRDALQRLPAERRDRDRGMALAAAKNNGQLEVVRGVAIELGANGWPMSIEDVREQCARRGLKIVWGNWAGSVFKGGPWVPVGYVQARHKGSHARVVRVWRLGE